MTYCTVAASSSTLPLSFLLSTSPFSPSRPLTFRNYDTTLKSCHRTTTLTQRALIIFQRGVSFLRVFPRPHIHRRAMDPKLSRNQCLRMSTLQQPNDNTAQLLSRSRFQFSNIDFFHNKIIQDVRYFVAWLINEVRSKSRTTIRHNCSGSQNATIISMYRRSHAMYHVIDNRSVHAT